MSRYFNDFSDLDSGEDLEHYGVPGMKWGVRKDPGYHAARTGWGTKRMAKRDANEFAKAKMYYGEGAGNRRKLIKNQVNQRSKDKFYKQIYDQQMGKQDWAKRAEGAKKERGRTDRRETAKKTTRGVAHVLAGDGARASAAALAIGGGIILAHKTGADKAIFDAGRDMFDSMRANATYQPYTVDDLLSGRMG